MTAKRYLGEGLHELDQANPGARLDHVAGLHLACAYNGDELAAVANCCACEPFAVADDATGWHLQWIPD